MSDETKPRGLPPGIGLGRSTIPGNPQPTTDHLQPRAGKSFLDVIVAGEGEHLNNAGIVPDAPKAK